MIKIYNVPENLDELKIRKCLNYLPAKITNSDVNMIFINRKIDLLIYRKLVMLDMITLIKYLLGTVLGSASDDTVAIYSHNITEMVFDCDLPLEYFYEKYTMLTVLHELRHTYQRKYRKRKSTASKEWREKDANKFALSFYYRHSHDFAKIFGYAKEEREG